MAVGIKASKKGKKATDKNIDNLALTSEYPALKTFDFGSGVVAAAGSTGEETIIHNLKYVPLVLVYIEDEPGSNRRYLVTTVSPELEKPAWRFDVDETKLVIKRSGNVGGDGIYSFFYYIFYDQS